MDLILCARLKLVLEEVRLVLLVGLLAPIRLCVHLLEMPTTSIASVIVTFLTASLIHVVYMLCVAASIGCLEIASRSSLIKRLLGALAKRATSILRILIEVVHLPLHAKLWWLWCSRVAASTASKGLVRHPIILVIEAVRLAIERTAASACHLIHALIVHWRCIQTVSMWLLMLLMLLMLLLARLRVVASATVFIHPMAVSVVDVMAATVTCVAMILGHELVASTSVVVAERAGLALHLQLNLLLLHLVLVVNFFHLFSQLTLNLPLLLNELPGLEF